jgi:hypothetical protein
MSSQVKRPPRHSPARVAQFGLSHRPLWWRVRNSDLDFWLTIILLPAAIALVIVVAYWR